VSIYDLIHETFLSVTNNKVRSSLTILGIVVGIASVILMVSIGQGSQAAITSSIEAAGSNLLIVQPGGRTSGAFGGGGGFGGSGGGGWLGPLILGNMLGRQSSGGGGGGTGGGPNGQKRRSGCGTIILIILVIFIIGIIISAISSSSGGSNITTSTVQREPLPKGSVNETGYYTDKLGWIKSGTTLESGMKHFYDKTGVQPYLYLTDNVNGSNSPTQAELQTYAEGLYNQLFTDKSHLLLVFFEYNSNSQYMDYYVVGSQAKQVVDSEAGNILLDYIDRYYYDKSFNEDQFFSKSFSDAADRMMTVTKSPWIPVFIVLGVAAVLLIGFFWWSNAKKQKDLEAKRREELLKTPLEKFGDTEAEELAKKYEDKDKL